MSRCWLWVGLLLILVQLAEAQENITAVPNATTTEKPGFFRGIADSIAGLFRPNKPEVAPTNSTLQPLPSTNSTRTPLATERSTEAHREDQAIQNLLQSIAIRHNQSASLGNVERVSRCLHVEDLNVTVNRTGLNETALLNGTNLARGARCLPMADLNNSVTSVSNVSINRIFKIFAEVHNGTENKTALNETGLVNETKIGATLVNKTALNQTTALVNQTNIGNSSERDAKCLPVGNFNNSLPSASNNVSLQELFKLFAEIHNLTLNRTVLNQTVLLNKTVGFLNSSSGKNNLTTDGIILRVGKELEKLDLKLTSVHDFNSSRNVTGKNSTDHHGRSITEFFENIFHKNHSSKPESKYGNETKDTIPRALFTRFFGIAENRTHSANGTERVSRNYGYVTTKNVPKDNRYDRYLTFVRKHNWTYHGLGRHLHNVSDEHRTYRELDDDDDGDYYYFEWEDNFPAGFNSTSDEHSASKTGKSGESAKNSTVKAEVVVPLSISNITKNGTSREERGLWNNTSRYERGLWKNSSLDEMELWEQNDTMEILFIEDSERNARELNDVNETRNSSLIIGSSSAVHFNIDSNLHNITKGFPGNKTSVIPKSADNKTSFTHGVKNVTVSEKIPKSFDFNISSNTSEVADRSSFNFAELDIIANENTTSDDEIDSIVFDVLPRDHVKNGSLMTLTITLDEDNTTKNASTTNHHITQEDLHLIFKFLKGNFSENSTRRYSYNVSVGSHYDPTHPKYNSTDVGYHIEDGTRPLPPHGNTDGRVDVRPYDQPPFSYHPPSQGFRIYLPPPLVDHIKPHFPNKDLPAMKLVCPPTSTQRCPFYIEKGMRKCYVPMDCPRAGQLCCRVGCGVECIDGILVPIPTHFY